MTPDAALWNLLAYALQSATLLVVSFALIHLARLEDPRLLLAAWRLLLLLLCLLPLLAPLVPIHPPGLSATLTVSDEVPGTTRQGSPSALSPIGVGLLLGAALVVAGSLGRVRRWGRSLRHLETLRQHGRDLVPLPPAVDEIQCRLGVNARFAVSPDVASPVTFGWRRPVVLLPEIFTDLPAAEQRGIVAHELLHVHRNDWWQRAAEELLGAVLWFHPGVTLLLDRIALAREQVVDRAVVELTADRSSYLKALRAVARLRLGGTAHALPFLTRSHLHQRVHLLLKETFMSKTKLACVTFVLSLTLAAVALLSAATFPLAAAQSEPLRVEGDIQPPEVIYKVPPRYPEVSREEKIEGIVVVQTVIDQEGSVTDIEVVQSLGAAFDEAVVEAIRQWRFQPARKDGEPVAVYYNLTIRFRLDGSKDHPPEDDDTP